MFFQMAFACLCHSNQVTKEHALNKEAWPYSFIVAQVSFHFFIFTSLVVTHKQLRCLPKIFFTPNNRCILDVVMCQDFDTDEHSQELPAELDKTIAVTGFFRRVVLRSRESPKGGDQT